VQVQLKRADGGAKAQACGRLDPSAVVIGQACLALTCFYAQGKNKK
jgi:hypothetical protein